MSELLAAMYDPLVAPFDPMGVRKWREWAVSAARGRTLEIGVGTGLNLPLYRGHRSVAFLAAIDPDGASLRRALARRNGNANIITLHQARAEALPFADESFDAVIGTLAFCTIGDPARALSEARRVLKTGGAFRLVEHVRVDNRLIASVQDWVTPLWKEIAGGCHLNRDTLSAVKGTGLCVLRVSRLFGGLVIGIDAVKP